MNREEMSNIADNPSYWLERAKEIRGMLKSVPDEEMEALTEEIAEGYERLAKINCTKAK
jgi:vacuolar-type H+-ATPase catalytic subunit A/Vma1